jgi:hypothetical protein
MIYKIIKSIDMMEVNHSIILIFLGSEQVKSPL